MANFLESSAHTDRQVTDFAQRLFRIEAHIRRGERRAARAQLEGFLVDLAHFTEDIEFPLETVIIGAQLGFFSGGGALRGRLPGALLGAVAGWLYGQQSALAYQRDIEAIVVRVGELATMLDQAEHEAAAEARAAAREAARDSGSSMEPNDAERATAEIPREELEG
jgi:hypothetical protein